MGSKGHFFISLSKSIIRIVGCAAAYIMIDIGVLAVSLAVAELLGIAEELADKR